MSWRFTRNETTPELGERLHSDLLAQRRQPDHGFEASVALGSVNTPKEKTKNRSHIALSRTVVFRNTRFRETKCCPTWPRMQR